MAVFLENHEGYRVRMKINMDVINRWKSVKNTLDIIWGGWGVVVNNN